MPETEIPQEVINKIEDTYNRYESMGYYGILGLKETATQDEIKRAFYRAVKEFHPDEYPYLNSADLKDKLHTIFAFITQAYKTLSDPDKRR
ncbi:MAG: J domain-containing protein, partial [Nitrospirota bacterium]